ncbi:hypothetical protein [Fluviicola sp.]|uniref:hypothetical protein n=1 Tax=Fluviicola sp. TaxID=1917219 RepID=UPI00262B92DE|nr:hypothetical protein [Fluviicola sp.]
MKIATTFLFTTLFLFAAFSQQKMVYGTFKRIHGFPKDLPRPKMDTLEFPIFIGKQSIVLKHFKKVKLISDKASYSGTWKFLKGTVELTFLIDSKQQTLQLQIAKTEKNTYLLDPNNKFCNFRKRNQRPKFGDKLTDRPYAGK